MVSLLSSSSSSSSDEEFCIPAEEAKQFRYLTTTEQEIEREFKFVNDAPSVANHMNTWFPTFSRDRASPLASLSSCYINLERGCDLHRDERARLYHDNWRVPAPTWCQGKRSDGLNTKTTASVIRKDRLGVPLSVYKNLDGQSPI